MQPPFRHKDVWLIATQFAGCGPAIAAQGRDDAVPLSRRAAASRAISWSTVSHSRSLK